MVTPAPPASSERDIQRVIELAHQPIDAWTYGGLYLVELEDGSFLLRRGVDIANALARCETVA